jgi:hypothetical protein
LIKWENQPKKETASIGFETASFLFIHKVYCWWVALQQSLLPLQPYNSKLMLPNLSMLKVLHTIITSGQNF